MKRVSTLILLRHGKSDWNQKNRFTGWVDVPLSREGIIEAQKAGQALADRPIDLAFVSTLMRAQMTAMIALAEHKSGKTPIIASPSGGQFEEWGKIYDPQAQQESIPVYKAWELNERMYGELQGCDKSAVKKKFGAKQFRLWRRSFATPPPNGESLEMTAARVIPYFKEKILPPLERGKNILVAAHGNSLRSIVKHLDHLSPEEVISLEIATGVPLYYSFDGEKLERKEL